VLAFTAAISLHGHDLPSHGAGHPFVKDGYSEKLAEGAGVEAMAEATGACAAS